MNYFSQTGQSIINGQNQRTSPNVDNGGVIFRVQEKVTFRSLDETRLFQKKNVNYKEDGQGKEELTKDEEDKFYKKVFKTSLI